MSIKLPEGTKYRVVENTFKHEFTTGKYSLEYFNETYGAWYQITTSEELETKDCGDWMLCLAEHYEPYQISKVIREFTLPTVQRSREELK